MQGKQNESIGGESLECGRRTEYEVVLPSGMTYDRRVDAVHGDNMISNQPAIRFSNMGDSLICDMPPKQNADNESLCNVYLHINTELKKSSSNKDGATRNDDGYRSFTSDHVDECIMSVDEAENLTQVPETDQPSASGLCEQIDCAEGLAEVETLVPGAQCRIPATSMKYSRHSESGKLDVDKGGKKPLSCPAATKILKAVEVLPTSNTGITSLETGENKLDQETKSRCYPDVISFHPDDSGSESILAIEEGKDSIVCKCQGFSSHHLQ